MFDGVNTKAEVLNQAKEGMSVSHTRAHICGFTFAASPYAKPIFWLFSFSVVRKKIVKKKNKQNKSGPNKTKQNKQTKKKTHFALFEQVHLD